MENSVTELSLREMEHLAGGKPGLVDGVVNFCSWVACGFHHNYRYTGKTKTDIDLVFHVKFHQQICKDCGHENWTRSAP